MYSGVPNTCLSENCLVSVSMYPSYRLVARDMSPILLSPKSVSLMWPSAVIRRLSGFRSLCTIPKE